MLYSFERPELDEKKCQNLNDQLVTYDLIKCGA
jgi:hypothetical protein